MIPTPLITTSWDDGHPLDLRVAEMLHRSNLQGTFYVPLTADAETMSPGQIRELSASFELGAHTLHHIDLTCVEEHRARHEIVASKSWLEDCTGHPCVMFCPPKGKYARRHLHMIREAGFRGMRTVELVSLDYPRPEAGLLLMPTTLQAFPHGRLCYAKNFARRVAFRNLWLYLLHGRSNNWQDLAQSLLRTALRHGGVFHLWGHSWEIQETAQWKRLEELFQFLGQFTDQAPALTNAQVCRAAKPRVAERGASGDALAAQDGFPFFPSGTSA